MDENAVDNTIEYIARYCKSYKVTPEVAVTHRIVQEVNKYYKEKDEGVIKCEP